MKRVTRDIDPADARDLLERVPRACLAYAGELGPQAQPVTLIAREGRYWVGIPEKADHRPGSGQEGVLLAAGGVHIFELRAVYIRGHVQSAAAPAGAPIGCVWFGVVPVRTVAWDYGSTREVDTADSRPRCSIQS